jgi:glycosyltransferase involved in cell wall biosynthesis
MIGATWRVLMAARKANAEVYHLHDPELIPVGLFLKWAGRRVIFDAHEDLPKQIRSKPYLHPFARRVFARCFGIFERITCVHMSGIVTATPAIRDKFKEINPRSMDIKNYPLVGELAMVRGGSKLPEVVYVGAFDASRGLGEIVTAMAQCKSGARLNLAGMFPEGRLRERISRLPGWWAVNELGYLSRSEVGEVLNRSVAGLVTLHPTPAYVDALPIKMFEYMGAGVPVIASNFPRWKEIVEGNRCGVCVDPLDTAAIASAIDSLIGNPALAAQMGANGRRAVLERFNWKDEEAALLKFYNDLFNL